MLTLLWLLHLKKFECSVFYIHVMNETKSKKKLTMFLVFDCTFVNVMNLQMISLKIYAILLAPRSNNGVCQFYEVTNTSKIHCNYNL